MNSRTLDMGFIVAQTYLRRGYRRHWRLVRQRGPVFVFFLLMFSLPIAAAAQPIVRGAALANACATCHGPDGQSQGAIPSIRALSKESFVSAMRAFQTGERQGTVMNRIAKGLDAADIETIAAYLAVKSQEQ